MGELSAERDDVIQELILVSVSCPEDRLAVPERPLFLFVKMKTCHSLADLIIAISHRLSVKIRQYICSKSIRNILKKMRS